MFFRLFTLSLALLAGLLSGCQSAKKVDLFAPAGFFTAGADTAPDKIVVYFDSQCPHCAHLWAQLTPAVEAGKLQVKWAPVQFLKQLSKDQGAALISAVRPVNAMQQHEASLQSATHGLVVDPKTLSASALSKVDQNTEMLVAASVLGVPAVFAKDTNGITRQYEGPLEAQPVMAWVAHLHTAQ